MKVLIEPRSGKCGLTVWQQGRFGQIARTLAIPTNPRTSEQTMVRSYLTAAARGWAGLTEAQRLAWTATAASLRSNPRLGLSGVLTGNNLYTKVFCNVSRIGGNPPTDPPVIPTFNPLPVTALEATWDAGTTFKLELTTTASPPDGSVLRAAPPCSAGRYSPPGMVILGTLGSPVANKITITSVYTARYGTPADGQKLFVAVNQQINGIADIPVLFSCIVPAKA